MSRARLPVVRAGLDWAVPLGGRLGRHPGDLSHHGVQQTRQRLRLALLSFVVVFTVLVARLVDLTVAGATGVAAHADSGAEVVTRPIITDRNGVVLATQIITTTLGADAAALTDGPAIAARLKAVLPSINEVRVARLLSGKRRYVVLKRGLTPAQRAAVLDLGNPALKLRRASSRVYPTGAMMSHVVGFASSDMTGLLGLERGLDHLAENQSLNQSVGSDFETTLDVRVQHGVRDILLQAMEKYAAKAAGAIIMDIHNGEILSLVSLPDFDTNQPLAKGQALHFNRMTFGVYELGSVFKVFTAAMALDGGFVHPDDQFDTTAALKIGAYEISDTHPQDHPLTIDEIIVHSSNTGSARIALRVPEDVHYRFLQRIGFTDRVAFILPERAAPLTPMRWTDIERATASYGHGISVSPLHVLVAGAAMINGGVLYPPSLQKMPLPVGERIISADTSKALRRMMRAVVVKGTGRQADVPGYQVMGKTGSADKPSQGSYSENAVITSFLAGFPASAPRYALLVMLDEPQGIKETHGYALAGWNAAPVAGNIIRRVAPILGVLPMDFRPNDDPAERQAMKAMMQIPQVDLSALTSDREAFHAP